MTNISKRVERVAPRKEVAPGKAGKPVAHLVPYEKAAPKRKPGSMKGVIRITRDFDDLPADILAAFRGERT